MIRALAATAAGLFLFSGTAAAYPINGAPDLTANPLYEEGKLTKTSCALKKGMTRSATEKYVRSLIVCLGKAWDRPGIKVEIHYQRDGKKKYKSWPFVTLDGIYVGLADDWIKAKNDLRVFHELASVYGEVVQVQTGIAKAAKTLDFHGDQKELDEQERRYAYQQSCFAGAAARALGRPAKSWKSLLKGNELAWFDRGYKAGGPSACNTWKASSAKVA